MDDGGDAVHLRPDEAGIDNRARSIGKGRWLQIDPARQRPATPERPENGLPEVASTAGDQNCHVRPKPAASGVENRGPT
jgi:hypothetical protein